MMRDYIGVTKYRKLQTKLNERAAEWTLEQKMNILEEYNFVLTNLSLNQLGKELELGKKYEI